MPFPRQHIPHPDMGAVVRGLLREATERNHERLNRHALLAGLLQPDYSLADYRTLLQALLQIYHPLELALLSFLDTHPGVFDYRPRLKTPNLLQDLAFLQSRGPVMPATPCLPNVAGLGELVGILYVIEGSTLGGQLIAKSLEKHLGLNREQGARFFHGYGELTAAMWLDFIRFSDGIFGDEKLCRAAKLAADQTFNRFELVLDGYVGGKSGG